MEEGDLSESSLSLALVDIEMLRAAYPDETICESCDSPDSTFPLHLQLHLADDAFIELEFDKGYPTESNVGVSRYRAGPRSKHQWLEKAVFAVKEAAAECRASGVEGGLACCAAAFHAWQEAKEAAETSIEEAAATTHTSSALSSSTPVASSKRFHWVSGEPLMDRKSTFQAHVCKVASELEVRLALEELICGNTKLQKATHNMVSILTLFLQTSHRPAFLIY